MTMATPHLAEGASVSSLRNVPMISVKNASKEFVVERDFLGRPIKSLKAVNDASLTINVGEVLGLVGESGSGKSTLGRLLLKLQELSGGEVEVEGVPISSLSGSALREFRKRNQMIFQDPYASLNKFFTIGRILSEPLVIQNRYRNESETPSKIIELLEAVGFGEEVLERYPHEFSGGQRQRIGIARALVSNPKFIVADEPVSALDVSVQAAVLNILSDLRRKHDLTMLFITHDLAVVRQIADRIAVMYLGRIMEVGRVEEVFLRPRHPYTRSLIDSVPKLRPNLTVPRKRLSGDIPNPLELSSGCPFRVRCPYAIAECKSADMVPKNVGEDHLNACVRPNILTEMNET